MSKLVRGAPARFVTYPRLQGPSNRQTYAAVDQARDAGNHRGDLTGIQQRRLVTTPYVLQINPRPEQPKLINSSAAQPVTIWGWRRFDRVHMTAGPRFLGRWAAVGAIIRSYADRGRMTGVSTRQGTTYQYTRPSTGSGTRIIQLSGNGG